MTAERPRAGRGIKAAGLFPGQGVRPQLVLDALDPADETVQEANALLGVDLRKSVSIAMRGGRRELPTEIAQPAIFVASVASFRRAEKSEDNDITVLAGHSLGEYPALVAGGAISFGHALSVVQVRAKAMSDACRSGDGGMMAVLGLSFADVQEIAERNEATIANDNAPDQVVLSAERSTLARCAEQVSRAGGRSTLLEVSGAFHSSAMLPARRAVADVLEHVWIRSPEIPVLSNITARPYRAPGEIRKLLVEQLTGRVRFRSCLTWLAEKGVTEFVDLGPGRVVAGLARRTVEGASVRPVSPHAEGVKAHA